MFALDIAENHMRILEILKKGDGFVLHGVAEKEIDHKERIPDLLKELVASAKPSPIVSRDIALVIPEEESFIKIAQAPKGETKTIQAFLEDEIDKILPYEKKEVYWDWRPTQSISETGMLDVMVVASPRSFVDGYIQMVTTAGFRPSLIETEPNALLWGIRNPFVSKTIVESTLVVNIGNKKTTVVVFANGAIRFSSSVKVGMAGGQSPDYLAMDWGQWVKTNKQEWAATEKSLISLTKKLHEYIDYYNDHFAKGNPQQELNKVIITGAWANFPELLEFLSKKLGIPAMKPQTIIPIHPAYTTVLGLALRGLYEEYYASL